MRSPNVKDNQIGSDTKTKTSNPVSSIFLLDSFILKKVKDFSYFCFYVRCLALIVIVVVEIRKQKFLGLAIRNPPNFWTILESESGICF